MWPLDASNQEFNKKKFEFFRKRDFYASLKSKKDKQWSGTDTIRSDPALKTKREITKYINWRQFTKGTRGKPNEQLCPK